MKFEEDYKSFLDHIQKRKTIESEILKNLSIIKVEKSGQEFRMMLELKVVSEYLNGFGGVFGGTMAAIIDSSATVLSLYLDERITYSMELNVTYVGVSKLGETLSIEVFCPKAGKNILFNTVEVRSKGKVIAMATNTRTFSNTLKWRSLINSPRL